MEKYCQVLLAVFIIILFRGALYRVYSYGAGGSVLPPQDLMSGSREHINTKEATKIDKPKKKKKRNNHNNRKKKKQRILETPTEPQTASNLETPEPSPFKKIVEFVIKAKNCLFHPAKQAFERGSLILLFACSVSTNTANFHHYLTTKPSGHAIDTCHDDNSKTSDVTAEIGQTALSDRNQDNASVDKTLSLNNEGTLELVARNQHVLDMEQTVGPIKLDLDKLKFVAFRVTQPPTPGNDLMPSPQLKKQESDTDTKEAEDLEPEALTPHSNEEEVVECETLASQSRSNSAKDPASETSVPHSSSPRLQGTNTLSKQSTVYRYRHDRQDWPKIRAISDETLCRTVAADIRRNGKRVPIAQVRVLSRTQGTYHHVVFMGVHNKDSIDEYVIRIPAHGTEDEWVEEDMIMLENEARLMRYIKLNTDIPIPEVIQWCSMVWNPLGAPYILMKKLEGKSAFSLWFTDENSNMDDELYLQADYPSKTLAVKRATLLRSLAKHMADLAKLDFPELGMPNCDGKKDETPKVGPIYHWRSKEPSKFENRGTFKSTWKYVLNRLRNLDESIQEKIEGESLARDDVSAQFMRGDISFMSLVFSPDIFPHCSDRDRLQRLATPETFTLHHNDLDLQNILTDGDGNVTGILDWDGCMAAPRFVGSAAVPKFLCADWFPDQDLERSPHLPWKLDEYRKQYAKYLEEFGCEDAKYTEKSAMYQAAWHTLTVSLDNDALSEKIIASIPSLIRMDSGTIIRTMGRGWPAMENHLRKELKRLFAPYSLEDTEKQRKEEQLKALIRDAHHTIDQLAVFIREVLASEAPESEIHTLEDSS
jgi:aminoglycoside phosphotransferase (APT) family kinase protein